MTIEQELELSYYQQVADIDADHGIYLVQDTRNKKFFVKKLLTVYNANIYRYLLEHPVANTPKTYLAEEDNNILTVIEEYIPGDTLEDILSQKKTLPEAEVLDIASQLCVILADFHRCEPAIVNRDIKPSNIKITDEGVVKLLDMNAAKWSNENAIKDTVLLGTQGYAAPEQYGFGSSSVLTDIYAVGVLINEMLCGELPNRRIAGGDLGKIARKCVELAPSAQYQSIKELQIALDDLSGKDTAGVGRKKRLEKVSPARLPHEEACPLDLRFFGISDALLLQLYTGSRKCGLSRASSESNCLYRHMPMHSPVQWQLLECPEVIHPDQERKARSSLDWHGHRGFRPGRSLGHSFGCGCFELYPVR